MNMAFGLSARIPIDCVKSKFHLQLREFEFIEALARCAEKLSLYPYGLPESQELRFNLSRRLVMPLYFKLESIFHFLAEQVSEKRRAKMDLPGEPLFSHLLEQKIDRRLSSLMQFDTEMVYEKNDKGQLIKLERLPASVNLSVLLHRVCEGACLKANDACNGIDSGDDSSSSSSKESNASEDDIHNGDG
jgi:hypothetical protein